MEQYLRERERQEKKSRVTGVTLTVSMHIALLICCFITGFTYLDPPPPEQERILIEFDEPEIQKPKQTWDGTRPRAAEPDPDKDINLVQRSEAQNEGTKGIFVGDAFEVMKLNGVGTRGHIAIKTSSVDRAIAYFERMGIEFDKDTVTYFDDGRPKFIYFKDEICGFAVHLIEK